MPSKLPFTSVVSLHTDPMTCGVANFSKQLADRLGVPFTGLLRMDWGSHPLLSLKASEFSDPDVLCLHLPVFSDYSVFWHDSGIGIVSDRARHVFYADPSLGPNGLFCPSLLTPYEPRPVKLFSFGMAHKLQVPYYAKLKQLLDDAGVRYHLRVSVGIHEGTSLSEATQHFDALTETMGPEHVTILGILTDKAVHHEIQDADCIVAFFAQGARLNNTTLHAALQARKLVYTNHDDDTAPFLRALTADIHRRSTWERFPPYEYTWDRLIRDMEQIYAATVENRPSAHR